MGAITAMTETGFAGEMRTVTDVRMAVIRPEDFTRLAVTQPSVHRRVMRAVRTVSARNAIREQNRERMASLGTMAAGLAHELQQSSTAARSAATDLAEALDVLASTIGLFVDRGSSANRPQSWSRWNARRSSTPRRELAGRARGGRRRGRAARFARAARAGPAVAADRTACGGRDRRCWLDRLAEIAGPAGAARAAVAWIAASLTAQGLAAQIAESTDRIGKP